MDPNIALDLVYASPPPSTNFSSVSQSKFYTKKKKKTVERETNIPPLGNHVDAAVRVKINTEWKWVKIVDLCFVILDLWLFCVSFLFRLDY